MARVLITGQNSFVGTSLVSWLANYPDRYSTHTISVRGHAWKKEDFGRYDVVVHVAGIAHSTASRNLERAYYSVNRDLAIAVAEKAKADGVRQFIFMSSIIVYGDSRNEDGLIDRDTVPTPKNVYGHSKLQAEERIRLMGSDNFRVVILRPPMIYGKGSRGNYPKLAKLAKFLPVFPDVDNARSMLYIENLCEFIRLIIDYEERGVFFPQNKEYVRTSEMVRLIAKAHGKEIRLTKAINPVIKLMRGIPVVNKVFGNLAYEQNMSDYDIEYRVVGFESSIERTEF